MRPVRRVAAAFGVGLALLLVPNSTTAPTMISLVQVEESTAVDFGDGVVVVLALGSDSPTPDPLEGSADAIELIALNFDTGAAAAVGIPRDTWVDVDGYKEAKINSGLLVGGPELMASEVEQLTGVAPQYVVTTGFAGFEQLVDTVGELSVRSEVAFTDEEYGLSVHEGPNNPLDGRQATGFARYRAVAGDDFTRMANHQNLLQAILVMLRAREDEEGFVESGALAALQHLDTDLSPAELYRFAQAIGQVDPGLTTRCVLDGTPGEVAGASVVFVAEEAAAAAAADAVDDGHLDGDC